MSEYDIKPKKIESIGNGSYFYRWDIKEVEKQYDLNEKVIKWECKEVVVWLPLSANKITEVVINELWGNGVEQKLLNEYNAFVLGLGKEEYKTNYLNFLEERERIKTQIDLDYNEWINNK